MFLTFGLFVEWFALGLDNVSEVHHVCSTHTCSVAIFTVVSGCFVLQGTENLTQTDMKNKRIFFPSSLFPCFFFGFVAEKSRQKTGFK